MKLVQAGASVLWLISTGLKLWNHDRAWPLTLLAALACAGYAIWTWHDEQVEVETPKASHG